jgi:hypothetical protein
MKFIAYNSVSLTCISLAAYMAIRNVSGWGWFLALGALAAVMPTKS